MNYIKLFSGVAIALFITSAAQAQLPSGRYSGFVSNNPFNEWCRLNQASMNFVERRDGSVAVQWIEEGFASYPGSGFCQNVFDATFTPTRTPNEWTVNFHWNFDLNFGRATLKDGVLTIRANFSGMRTGYQSFQTRLVLSPENRSISYQRRIDRMGPTLFATGTLRQ